MLLADSSELFTRVIQKSSGFNFLKYDSSHIQSVLVPLTEIQFSIRDHYQKATEQSALSLLCNTDTQHCQERLCSCNDTCQTPFFSVQERSLTVLGLACTESVAVVRVVGATDAQSWIRLMLFKLVHGRSLAYYFFSRISIPCFYKICSSSPPDAQCINYIHVLAQQAILN